MDWTIVNTKNDQEVEKKFTELFNKYECNYKFISPETKSVLISDVNQFNDIIQNINNILILDANRFTKSPSFMYLLG